jgi:hypothetical protein
LKERDRPVEVKSGAPEGRTNLLLFLFFILLSAVVKFGFHELWKDEWQAWLLAVRTNSFADLAAHLPGEGHPALWFFLLRSWNALFMLLHIGIPDEVKLQLLHFLLVSAVYYLLFFRIKAAAWFKCAVCLSYFFFFEYGILDRGYVLVMMGCFALTVFFQEGTFSGRTKWLMPLCFFLLTQAEVYGTMIGGSFLVYFFLSFIFQKKDKKLRSVFFITAGAFFSGVILFYLQVSPDNAGSAGDLTFSQLSGDKGQLAVQALQSLTANLFLPGLFETIYKSAFNIPALAAGLILLAGMIYVFKNSRALLIAFLVCFAGFFLFTMVLYIGGPRQWGNLIIAFFCFYLIGTSRNELISDRISKAIIGLVLFVQCIHSVRAIADDVRLPFSNSKAAGNFIKNEFPGVPVIGINKFFCVPVIGYAGVPFYSMPQGNEYHFFEINDWRGKMYMPTEQELAMFRSYKHAPFILVVFNKPLPAEQYPHVQLLKTFDGPNLRGENYFIYRF